MPQEKLPRQVKLFGAVSLLNDTASEMIYPLLPAFLTTTLGAGAVALGALDGAAECAAAAAKLGTGRLADRPSRRGPLIVGGYLVAVLVRPLIALTAAAWQVIALRVTDRVGKGARTPARDAFIADIAPPALQGRAFGLQRGMDHAGAVLGPLAAWALLSFGGLDERGVIGASVVPGVLVLVLAVVAVRGGSRRYSAVPEGSAPPATASYRPLPPPPALYFIVAFSFLRLPETLLILRTQDLGIPVASVTLLWAGLHVVRSSSSFVGGRLSDRIGARRTMWLGWLCYGALAAGLAVAGSAAQAAAVFLALGVVAGLTESPERALVSGLGARDGRLGSAFGRYHAATGLAALAGGIGLGAAYQTWGGSTACLVSAGLAVVLVIVAAAPRAA